MQKISIFFIDNIYMLYIIDADICLNKCIFA